MCEWAEEQIQNNKTSLTFIFDPSKPSTSHVCASIVSCELAWWTMHSFAPLTNDQDAAKGRNGVGRCIAKERTPLTWTQGKLSGVIHRIRQNPIFTWKYYQGRYSGHVTSSLWQIDEYMRALGDEERIRTHSKVVPKIEKLAWCLTLLKKVWRTRQ